MTPDGEVSADRRIHSGEYSALTSADRDEEIRVLVDALKEAVRMSSGASDAYGRASIRSGTSESDAPLERTLQEVERRLPLKEFRFPSRLPVIGGLVALIQEQLGRLGSKYHTRNLLNQQNDINAALLATLLQFAHALEEQRTQTRQLSKHVEHDVDAAVGQVQLLTTLVDSFADESRGVRKSFESRLETLKAEVAHRLESREAEVTGRLETREAELETRLHNLEDEVNTQLLAMRELPDPSAKLEAFVEELEPRLLALENIGYSRGAEPPDSMTSGVVVRDSGVVVRDSGFNYFAFELKFRGTPRLVRDRQRQYIDLFQGKSNVLDIGCGRGEFLELLAAEGVSAYGVDQDPQMVAYCRALDLPVDQVDAITHLDSLPDNSLGGVFAAQVLEHLDLAYTLRLLHACHKKMKAGAPIVLETPNPLCLGIFAHSFYQDPTHIKPVHPATLQFLLSQTGFIDQELRLISPVSESEHLRAVPADDSISATVGQALNENVAKLNALLFGAQDYAIVARKFVWVQKSGVALTGDISTE